MIDQQSTDDERLRLTHLLQREPSEAEAARYHRHMVRLLTGRPARRRRPSRPISRW